MRIKAVGNYSIRFGPQHRRMLNALSERTQRKPSDVLRWLIQEKHALLVNGQQQQSQTEASDD